MPPMILAAWLHTLSPFLVRFSDSLGLRWYGMAYLAGFLVGFLLLRALSRRGLTPIPLDRVDHAIMWLIGGVLVGGRLGYVLIYDRALLWTMTDSFPWWNLLAINKGGMASHGGMIGAAVAAWRISRGWTEPDGARVGACPPLHVMDLTCMLAPCGLFFGRIANFVNGELLGKVVSPPGTEGPWWSVQFPQELRGWDSPGVRDVHSHAPDLSAQQQSQLSELVHSVALPGDSFADALERIIQHAARYAGQLKPLLSSRHPSQIYQAVAEGLVVGAIVWAAAARPRKPGVVGAVFLISYGALRIVTEFVRLPDAQFDVGRPLGLSRGQWLSAAMVAAGACVLAWASRRNVPRLGGWRTPTATSPARAPSGPAINP